MHIQSSCFGSQTYCFIDVLVAVAVAKAPQYLSICSMKRAHAWWKVIIPNHRDRGSIVFSTTTLANAD